MHDPMAVILFLCFELIKIVLQLFNVFEVAHTLENGAGVNDFVEKKTTGQSLQHMKALRRFPLASNTIQCHPIPSNAIQYHPK